MNLHISGSLLEMLAARHPDLIQKIKELVATGRLEMLSGGFFEPVLVEWSEEDRDGQLAKMAAWLKEKLGVEPAGVVEGRAPEALAELPDPDRVLRGGGGRGRLALLQAVLPRLRPGGVLVVPLATVEALAELRPALEQAGLRVGVSQLQAWRGAPLADGTRLSPLNPVLVLRGQRP